MRIESVNVISGSDGPTSVFILEGHKPNIKQRIQKNIFQLRKKWFALWLKPGTHTMDELVSYIKEKYHFIELSKDSPEYRHQYDDLRTSFMMRYQPELLGEYANPPELVSKDEAGMQEFHAQMKLRQQKAKEVPEEVFSLDYHYLEKEENNNYMHVQLESRFDYIGGGASGKKEISKFQKMYKDIYKYYGVSESDIVNNTERYQNLLKTLAMRH